MALHADAVNRDALLEESPHEIVHEVGEHGRPLDGEVVKKEQCVGVFLVGPSERVRDVAGTEALEEDRLSQSQGVTRERLVDDDVAGDATAISRDDRAHVRFESGTEAGGVERFHECRHELVPDERRPLNA